MSSRTEAIAAELRQIRGATAEDLAVLMMPLIRAVEDGWASWEQGADGIQLASMANSLAQLAAQLGDMETAVAIASLQADIEALTADDRSPAAAIRDHASSTPHMGSTATQPDLDPGPESEPQTRSGKGLAGPSLKLLAALGIGALTYAGYLAINGYPGTPAKTVSVELPTEPIETGSQQHAEQPIALWWMGAGPLDRDADLQPRSPMIPTARPPTQLAVHAKSEPEPERQALTAREADDSAPASTPNPIEDAAARSRADESPATAAPSRQARYRGFIDQDVMLTDGSGGRHQGVLTDVSADGITLRTEVQMFGEPIVAHRLFPFATIDDIRGD